MDAHSRIIGATFALTATLAAMGFGLATAAESPDCVHAWPEARSVAYGYDHIVHVRNDCRVQANCSVASDVSPTPTDVTVRAGDQAEVTTSHAAPSREFTPVVECRFTAASERR